MNTIELTLNNLDLSDNQYDRSSSREVEDWDSESSSGYESDSEIDFEELNKDTFKYKYDMVIKELNDKIEGFELKEGMEIMYNDVGDIIKGYLEDLNEELELYDCEGCKKEDMLFIIDEEDEYFVNIGECGGFKCNNCELIWCKDCVEEDDYDIYTLKKYEICNDCFNRREVCDRGYYLNTDRIEYMSEYKGIDVSDMCEEVDSDWDSETEFYDWNMEWNEHFEDWLGENKNW